MKFFKWGLACLFLMNGLTAFSQYNTLSEWYIGPSAGVSASSITLSPKYVDKMYILGKNGGLAMRYISEDHFGLQMEFNYMEAGWLEDYYVHKTAADFSYSRKMTYLEVPFLMHAYSKLGAARFFLNVGPKFSYLINERETDKSPVTYPQIGKSSERPFQYGVLGGAGFEVHIGPTVLGLEGRYCYGLSNIFNDAIGEDFVTSDLQVISLNLHLLFQLSGR